MEEDLLEEIQIGKNTRIIKKPYAFLYEIDIDDYIESPNNYREERELLRSAQPNDIVKINFCSGGGRLDTTMSLVSYLRSTQATTLGCLESECHSGASVLFLCCDQHQVAPHSRMLIHEASYGVFDSSDKLHRHVDFSKRQLRQIYEDVYEDFLTEDEINQVLSGQDMWLGSEEIVERLEKRNELRAEREDVENEIFPESAGGLEDDDPHIDINVLDKEYSKGYFTSVYNTVFGEWPKSRMTKKEIIDALLEDMTTTELHHYLESVEE